MPGSVLFRDIFYTFGKDKFTTDDIQKIVYTVPENLAHNRFHFSDPENPFRQIENHLRSVKPSHLYEHGLAKPPKEIIGIRKIFDEKGPVTLIFFPGIFGEFISNAPFHEVLECQSCSFAKDWEALYWRNDSTPYRADSVYSLEENKVVQKSMLDLMQVASIDDETGKPLVKIAYLKPLFGSLESMGHISENAHEYLRRITKFLKVVGPQKNLYFMGYSRGASVELETLVAARRDMGAYPWAKDVKGVIAHAGVLYGSGIADTINMPDNINYRMFDLVIKLVNELDDEARNPIEFFADVSRNNKRWAAAMAEFAALGASVKRPRGIELEDIVTDAPAAGALAEVLMKVSFDNFELHKPLSRYFENVRKFKTFAKAALKAVNGLTTKARLTWWKDNVIPEDVSLYAISGSMADLSAESTGVWKLTGHPLIANTFSRDYRFLRTSFYDLSQLTGIELNDSMVTYDKARFWPALNRALNRKAMPNDFYDMGVIATDHWGLAFPVAIHSVNNQKNPFPRELLLKSIGAFVLKNQKSR